MRSSISKSSRCSLVCGALVLGTLWTATLADDRLNVVFILVDDLGWTDLGCYGSDFYETPRIDDFAARSLKFTSAYAAAPVCSPTRGALMTGKSPARLQMTIWHEGAVAGGPKNRDLLAADSQPNLPREEVTLAEQFKAAGYFTGHVGKWHLGTAAYYPETQGFDLNVGGTFWGAPSTFYHPFRGRWNDRDSEIRYVPGLGPGKPDDYLTDRLTDEALKFIESSQHQPFFLNLWFYTVHSPIEGKPQLVRHYDSKTPGKKHSHRHYAAMVSCLDQNVGRVLDKLDELQLTERTVVILTSDNGGVDFDTRGTIPTTNQPLRSGKGTLYEGGIRVPLVVYWPGRTQAGTVCHVPVSSEDFYPTLVRGLSLNAETSQDLDGATLLPLLENPQAKHSRDTFYWHFPHYYPRMTPGSAIRRENWKLIHYYEGNRVELYDLSHDIGEAEDLAVRRPSIAAALRRELDQWRERVHAKTPRPNLNLNN